MLIRMKYIFQKQSGGVYYYRRRVPTDLKETLGNKDFVCSLKTHNALKAQALAKQVSNELEAEWNKARQGETGSLKEAQELLNDYDVGIEVEDIGDLGKMLFLDKLV